MTRDNQDRETHIESPKADQKLILRFVCLRCGCRDLRTKMLFANYPVATLDGLEVTAGTLEFVDLHQREDPFHWDYDDHWKGWKFWCDKCGPVPDLAQYDRENTEADSLARWLLDNCPQDECLPSTETDLSTG